MADSKAAMNLGLVSFGRREERLEIVQIREIVGMLISQLECSIKEILLDFIQRLQDVGNKFIPVDAA